MTELKRALVTGASGGIGAATVQALRTSGREVLAVVRRESDACTLVEETGCETLIADVRDISALDAAAAAFQPDIVVNNAGVGHGIDGLLGLEADKIAEAVEINVTAPIRLTGACLPGMKARGRGHIINIGSIAGLHTLISSLYGATKAAVHIFSQNLRTELAGSGLRVTEIAPGRVESAFYENAKGDPDRLAKMGKVAIRSLTPEDIAAAILFAVDAPDHVNVALIEILPTDQTVGGVNMQSSKKA